MWGVLWKNWYVLSSLGTGWGKVWRTMGRLYLYRILKVRMRMILGMWMLNRKLQIWWALFEEWSKANLEEKLVNLVCFEIEGCECGYTKDGYGFGDGNGLEGVQFLYGRVELVGYRWDSGIVKNGRRK